MKREQLILGFLFLLFGSWLLALYLFLSPLIKSEFLVWKGNVAFEKAAFGDAEVFYKNAMVLHPKTANQSNFNTANSLYRQGRISEAIPLFLAQISSADSMLKHKTWFNLGNARFVSGDTLKSLEAFSQALILNRTGLKTRQNYLFVLNTLKEKADKKKQTSTKPDQQNSKDSPENRSKAGEEDKGKSAEEKPEQKVELSDKNIEDLLSQISKNEEAVRGKINNTKQVNHKIPPDEKDY